MEFKTSMTFEEALKIEGRQTPYFANPETDKERFVRMALDGYNFRIREYSAQKVEYIEDLKICIENTGDDFESLDIRFETIEEYVARKYGKLKFNAWSVRYVYVREVWETGTNIIAVERNPCDNLNDPIGGG